MTYIEYLEKHREKAFICHLPCDIEDVVYIKIGKNVHLCTVADFSLSESTVDLNCMLPICEHHQWVKLSGIKLNEFGKTLFLDREEAEKGV